MSEIIKNYVKKELVKIAFYLRSSAFFLRFPPKMRKTLESLPVEWTGPSQVKTEKGDLKPSPKFDGETQLDWQDTPTWKVAECHGRFQDKDLKIIIRRSSSRNVFKIFYSNEEFSVDNLEDLVLLFVDLEEGKSSVPELKEKSYEILNKKKTEINNYSKKYYLFQASNSTWEVKVDKDYSRIYVTFSVNVGDESEKKDVDKVLLEQDKFRLNSVGSYLKKLLKNEEIDVSKLNFTHRLLSDSDKSGFKITIK
jgi:hypothetical protein